MRFPAVRFRTINDGTQLVSELQEQWKLVLSDYQKLKDDVLSIKDDEHLSEDDHKFLEMIFATALLHFAEEANNLSAYAYQLYGRAMQNSGH